MFLLVYVGWFYYQFSIFSMNFVLFSLLVCLLSCFDLLCAMNFVLEFAASTCVSIGHFSIV